MTPEHYDMEIQPITYIMANGLGFCEGNIVKYVSRYKEKGGIEDLKKARHYLDMLIDDWIEENGDPDAYNGPSQAELLAQLEQQKQDRIAANKAWAGIMEADKNGELNNQPDDAITEVTPEDFVNMDFFMKPTNGV